MRNLSIHARTMIVTVSVVFLSLVIGKDPLSLAFAGMPHNESLGKPTISTPAVATPAATPTVATPVVAVPADSVTIPAKSIVTTKVENLKGFPDEVQKPIKVGVSVFVNSINKVNDAAGSFDASVSLRLRWTDPRLKFDSKESGTDRQEFGYEAATAKLATMWSPLITVSNNNDKSAKVESGLLIFADGSVLYTQRIKASFENKYNLRSFPFDTQTLAIVVSSTKYTTNKIALVQDQKDIDDSGVKEDTSIFGWKLQGFNFTAGTTKAWNGDYLPEMRFQLSVTRDPASYMFSIFIPFILLMLVPTIITLYAKADVAPRLTAWSGSILALIALNFTLSVRYAMLDADSIVMQLVTIGFVYQMLMVLLTVTLFNPLVAEKIANKYIVNEIVNFSRWIIPLGLVSFIVFSSLITAVGASTLYR